jgi:hypothetical protein
MHFAMLNDTPYFLPADHPFRPRHLLNGVRQKQVSGAARSSELFLNFATLHHAPIVQPRRQKGKGKPGQWPVARSRLQAKTLQGGVLLPSCYWPKAKNARGLGTGPQEAKKPDEF